MPVPSVFSLEGNGGSDLPEFVEAIGETRIENQLSRIKTLEKPRRVGGLGVLQAVSFVRGSPALATEHTVTQRRLSRAVLRRRERGRLIREAPEKHTEQKQYP
jgi:hypothetical protein